MKYLCCFILIFVTVLVFIKPACGRPNHVFIIPVQLCHACNMKESLKKYLEYLDSDEEFSFKVRTEAEWDDRAYQEFIRLITAVINDYKDSGLIPIPVMLFFTSGLDQLIGTVTNPLFFKTSSKAYEDLVRGRVAELEVLQKKFLSGELFMQS